MKRRIVQRWLALLLALWMCCGITLTGYADAETVSGTCGENLTWSFENGVLTISGTGDMYEDLYMDKIPWQDFCDSIHTIQIEDGVTSIADHAFSRCGALETVSISSSVKVIGSEAFSDCTTLKTVCVPEGVTTIEAYAFSDCTALETVTIPESVTNIGQGIVYDTALYKNNDNWKNDALYLDGCLVSARIMDFSVCTVQEGTRLIAQYAFRRNMIYGVILPQSVQIICDCAFASSTVRYVHIPAAVGTIGKSIMIIADNGFFDFACAYICSDAEDCFAHEYANANNMRFYVCRQDHDAEPVRWRSTWVSWILYRIRFQIEHPNMWTIGFIQLQVWVLWKRGYFAQL